MGIINRLIIFLIRLKLHLKKKENGFSSITRKPIPSTGSRRVLL